MELRLGSPILCLLKSLITTPYCKSYRRQADEVVVKTRNLFYAWILFWRFATAQEKSVLELQLYNWLLGKCIAVWFLPVNRIERLKGGLDLKKGPPAATPAPFQSSALRNRAARMRPVAPQSILPSHAGHCRTRCGSRKRVIPGDPYIPRK